MVEFLIVIFLICSSFIAGQVEGKADGRIEIGEACLKKGSFEVKGHTFKCERTKIKEGL